MALTRPALLAVCEGVYPLEATGSLGDSGIRKLRFARRVDAGDGLRALGGRLRRHAQGRAPVIGRLARRC